MSVLPHASKTVGGVGAVDVADGQATVDEPFGGIVTETVALTVIVCVTLTKLPQASVTR